MNFEWKIAIRYFRNGGMQSVLTVMGVTVGVTVFVFISCLIYGLQNSLVERILGSLSHVTVEPKESDPRVLTQLASRPGSLVVARAEKFGQQEPRIPEWKPLVAMLDREAGLTAVSPIVSGAGFATRGNQTRAITYRGVEPDRANGITDLRGKMKQGVYDVSGQNCVVGVELAKRLGVRLKDKISTKSSKGRSLTFTVAGIFDSGVIEINERSFYISLSNAQRLLDLVGYVTAVETKVGDIFAANAVADRLSARTGYEVKSWMRQNREFLGALQGQSGTSGLIKVFTMVSVAFGIASVLIVSVVQRSREIGILKSMGAGTGSITRIFLLQGLFVGLIGSIVGCVTGSLLVWALMKIPGQTMAGNGQLFPVEYNSAFLMQAILISVVVGVLAGIAPARRAAKLDPVDVIRYG